jgi:hypothetical protein
VTKAIAKSAEAQPAKSGAEPNLLSLIERVLTDPSLPLDRVEQAFAFYQKVRADAARQRFMEALVEAQSEMEPVRKDATNPQTRSRYATYDALDRAIRPIYVRHGFAPTYRTEPSEHPDHVRVVMTLMHIGGHERDYVADLPADGKGAKGNDVMTKTHAFGSALSYGRRYVLGGAFNVITTERDDDGNAAGGSSSGPITDDQAERLRALITETGTDIDKFLAVAKADSVPDIAAKDYARLVALLERKKEQKHANR